jgi:hypothetical protein
MTQKRIVRGISKPTPKAANVRKPEAPALPPVKAAAPKVNVAQRVAAQAAVAPRTRPARARSSTAPAAIRTLTTVDYAGESVPVNARQSRVAIDFSQFGTKPDQNITPRTQAVYDALKAQYGGQPFQRGNIDSGVLKFLGAKGWISHVSGGATDPGAQFRITN